MLSDGHLLPDVEETSVAEPPATAEDRRASVPDGRIKVVVAERSKAHKRIRQCRCFARPDRKLCARWNCRALRRASTDPVHIRCAKGAHVEAGQRMLCVLDPGTRECRCWPKPKRNCAVKAKAQESRSRSPQCPKPKPVLPKQSAQSGRSSVAFGGS